MKKILLLIGLIATLSSCGGGGGGSQTSQATPTPNPNKPTQNSGNIGSNESSSIGQNTGNTAGTNNGNNNGQTVQPQNPAPAPQTPTVDNRFLKPVDSREITGKGVKVGVLDSDFLSGDAKTEGFHTRRDYEGFQERDTFAQVINEEFGNRLIAINKTLGPNSRLNKSDHGLIVATILAGKNGKGAKGSSVYGVSFGESGKSLILDKSKYEELYINGVRIFNQSFGAPNNLAKDDDNLKKAKRALSPSTLRQIEMESLTSLDWFGPLYLIIFLQENIN